MWPGAVYTKPQDVPWLSMAQHCSSIQPYWWRAFHFNTETKTGQNQTTSRITLLQRFGREIPMSLIAKYIYSFLI